MDILGNDIRTCPICKKQFGVLHPEDWVYKRRRGGGPVQYFDRYNCMRIFDKRKEKKEEDKPVKEDKRRKGPDQRWLIDGVMAAIAQGDSGKQFLIDEGYRNYSVKWKDLKAWADRHDPELREKMPESLAEKKKPAEVEKVEKVPPVELNLQGGMDYQLKIDEAMQEDEKEKKPGFQYEIKTIETEIGEFSYDRKAHLLIFRRRDEEKEFGYQYMSMSTREWDRLLIIVPQLAEVMGVTL